jgi:hypothetical protein
MTFKLPILLHKTSSNHRRMHLVQASNFVYPSEPLAAPIVNVKAFAAQFGAACDDMTVLYEAL